MNFDFLQKHFPDCRIALKDIDGDTFAEVYASAEAEPVAVISKKESSRISQRKSCFCEKSRPGEKC